MAYWVIQLLQISAPRAKNGGLEEQDMWRHVTHIHAKTENLYTPVYIRLQRIQKNLSKILLLLLG